jgi:chromosome condensin MukBEF ATPase and DNA-binding subunit MukB
MRSVGAQNRMAVRAANNALRALHIRAAEIKRALSTNNLVMGRRYRMEQDLEDLEAEMAAVAKTLAHLAGNY